MRTLLVLAILVSLSSGPETHAEEAILRNGRHQRGTLSFDQGLPHFTPAGTASAVPLAEIHAIRLPPTTTTPLRAPRVHRVLLVDGQRLTGALLGLDEQRLRLRTAWAEELTVPRAAVAAVLQRPGQVLLDTPDFEGGLKGWNATGGPMPGDDRSPFGGRCLVLNRPGQTVERVLETPLSAGSFGINFRADDAEGAEGWLEANFETPGGHRSVRTELSAESAGYRAEVPDLKGSAAALPATPGWHRLRFEFAPTELVVTVDERALWYSRQQGPGGPLRSVRLGWVAAPVATVPRGAMAVADFSLAATVEELPHTPADAELDEVWLVSGDQLLGHILRADDRTIALQGHFGERTFPWSEVRGLFLRRGTPIPPAADRGAVQVRFWPGVGAESDVLDGTVQEFDEQRLVLQHTLLGRCVLERGRLRELRWLLK